jgi:hypothetical protein
VDASEQATSGDTFEGDMTDLLHHLLANEHIGEVPNVLFGTKTTDDGATYKRVVTFLLPSWVELGIVEDYEEMLDPNAYVFTEVTMGIKQAIIDARVYLDQVERRLVPAPEAE